MTNLNGEFSTSSEKKEALLRMPAGCDKPHWETKLGQALSKYTNEKSATYDPVFNDAIRSKNFQWFINTASMKKEKLLSMVVGCDRPKYDTELGQALNSYTHKGNSSYDITFNKMIREKHPQWFINTASIRKEKLLNMPVGCNRPKNKNRLGQVLSNYTNKGNTSYDAIFDKMIRGKHPQWFINTASIRKEELLNMPIGCDRPTKLSRFLTSYTYKGSFSYDEMFDKMIREKHPQWFRGGSSSEKKEALLNLSVGCNRPNYSTELGKALSNYISKKSRVYDSVFDTTIREKHPKWFRGCISSSNNKEELLNMPVGCERPHWKSKLSHVLSNYTNEKSNSYDPEFNKVIRVKHPKWFI